MLIILDYDSGNTHSIKHACSYLGYEATITSDIESIYNASKIIVPGQGAFKQAMDNLNSKNLISPLKKILENGVPFLGICLGFQILFESSSEHINSNGLGVLPGHITPIKAPDLKIPHMGWNNCLFKNKNMFKGIDPKSYFYFVHSFCLYQTSENIIGATTEYDSPFISAIKKENIWGTQFHPEKSSRAGLKLLQNFLSQDN